MATVASVLRYARRLQEISPGFFLAEVVSVETGEDYRNRDLLDQVARLIEIFGMDGAADIVGCPLRPFGDGGE
jgi:hypothetical protein